jgi:hypothetical protein
MSVVRPEFGPTLPELLGPRLRALPRAGRIALAVLGLLILLLLARVLFGGDSAATKLHGVVVREPLAANFVYRAPFHKQPPGAGELARIAAPNGQSFALRELRVPPYKGDAAGMLPVYASQLEDRMARELPGFVWRYDGRVNVNRIQGYEIGFQYRRGGKLTYGRRILLLPTTTATQGADLLLTSPRMPSVARYDAVGRNGGLKTALRSFRFGTERP